MACCSLEDRQLLVEELGHHFERVLTSRETRGDEGAHFRDLLRSVLSSSRLPLRTSLREDRGVIEIDGQRIEVEFSSANQASSFITDLFQQALQKDEHLLGDLNLLLGSRLAGQIMSDTEFVIETLLESPSDDLARSLVPGYDAMRRGVFFENLKVLHLHKESLADEAHGARDFRGAGRGQGQAGLGAGGQALPVRPLLPLRAAFAPV